MTPRIVPRSSNVVRRACALRATARLGALILTACEPSSSTAPNGEPSPLRSLSTDHLANVGSVGALPPSAPGSAPRGPAPPEIPAASPDGATLGAPLRLGVSAGYHDAEAWLGLTASEEFRRAGVPVQVEVHDRFVVLESFAAGRLDAIATTNAEALTSHGLGAPCSLLTPTWASQHGDGVLISAQGRTWKELAGKTVAVELGTVEHHWLEQHLAFSGVPLSEVHVVNVVPEIADRALGDGRGLGWFPSEKDATGPADALVLAHEEGRRSRARAPKLRSAAATLGAPTFVSGVFCVRPSSLSVRLSQWTSLARSWEQWVTGHVAAVPDQSPFRLVSIRSFDETELQRATRALDVFFQRHHVYAGSHYAEEEWRYRVVPPPHLTRP